MTKTTITKDDGRYLIFYTFEDESDTTIEPSDQESNAGQQQPEPENV